MVRVNASLRGYICSLSLFSTRRICSREQRKKQHDWLATNTDDMCYVMLFSSLPVGALQWPITSSSTLTFDLN